MENKNCSKPPTRIAKSTNYMAMASILGSKLLNYQRANVP
jgi:hypothetical protein